MGAARWGIGIAVTVAGNTLISLALNLQKLAHVQASERAKAADARDSLPRAATDADTLLPKNQERPSFLHSRIWWAGIALMGFGECGNFLSYGFAPASLVAPLGAVSLLANVAIAPALLDETVGATDVLGILLAIIGAVIVVACSGRSSDELLDPAALWAAVCRPVFCIYTLTMLVLGVVLALLVRSPLGSRTALVSLGECAVSGAFTVLATKGVSSFLLGARHVSDVLTEPLFFALLLVIVVTAVIQLTYLNSALQHFDARLVVPTQFVLFTVSTIVGSSILYRDFAQLSPLRITGFAVGCVVTFLGVYVLSIRETEPPGEGTPSSPPCPSPVAAPTEEHMPSTPRHPGHARKGSKNALAAVAAIVSNPQTYLVLHDDAPCAPSMSRSASAPHSPPYLSLERSSPREIPVLVSDDGDGVRAPPFLGISSGRNLLLARDLCSPTRPRSEHLMQ